LFNETGAMDKHLLNALNNALQLGQGVVMLLIVTSVVATGHLHLQTSGLNRPGDAISRSCGSVWMSLTKSLTVYSNPMPFFIKSVEQMYAFVVWPMYDYFFHNAYRNGVLSLMIKNEY